jgi:methylmalonyl-CoA mutase
LRYSLGRIGVAKLSSSRPDRRRRGAATRARATVGEISDALETIRAVSGVYGGQYEGDEDFRRVRREIAAFARTEERRPRMLVAKLGQDGHGRGAKVIATAFADIGPLFQTPEEAARQAVAHRTLVPALIEALEREGAGDILVVVGGVIPPKDYDFLKQTGVSAIYGPGTNIPKAAAKILSLIQKRRLAA